MKKYICIKGSPEIPKGSEAIEITHETRELPYNIQCEGKHIIYLFRNSVEQNPECWEEIKEEVSEKWVPKHKEKYWYIDSFAYIETSIWINGNCDKNRFSTGNVFSTKPLAEEELIRRKSIAGAWHPKERDICWIWDFCNGFTHEFIDFSISSLKSHIPCIYIGACHKTREECERWGETVAPLFSKVIGL